MLFKVRDVEKCIKNVGADDYKANITSRAKTILRELLQSTTYLHTGDLSGTTAQASSSRDIIPHNPDIAQEQILKHIGNTLRTRLQEDLDKEGGIELHDVLIRPASYQNLRPCVKTLKEPLV